MTRKLYLKLAFAALVMTLCACENPKCGNLRAKKTNTQTEINSLINILLPYKTPYLEETYSGWVPPEVQENLKKLKQAKINYLTIGFEMKECGCRN